MDKRFDVIIVGSGAGGGTLARQLAPSGKSILHSRARRLAQARGGELGCDGRVRAEPLHIARDLVRPRRPAVSAPGALFRRRRDQDVRRGALSPAARRISASCAITTASRRRGRSPTTNSSRITREAEQMYHVHGLRGRDPTEPPASGPYPCPPVSNEPRIQQLSDNLTAAGYHPFPAPCAVMLDEQNMAYSTCIRCQTCDGFPCLVHAKSDAEIVAVRPALEFPNVTLLRNAKALKLRDERRAAQRSRRWLPTSRGSARSSAATSSSCHAERRIRPSCC